MTDETLASARAALAQGREHIAEFDRGVVERRSQRRDLALETGVLKRKLGLPILDPEREAAVIRTAVENARQLQLPEELVREIFWRILGMSRGAQQETDR